MRPAAFADKVSASVTCGPLLFLLDRVSSENSPLKKLSDVIPAEAPRVKTLIRCFGVVLGEVELRPELREHWIGAIARDRSLSNAAIEEIIKLMQEFSMAVSFLKRLRDAIAALPAAPAAGKEEKSTDSVKEEDLCPICYTEPVDTLFKPCGHRSCGVCIRRQLTVKSICFLCNQVVDSLEAIKPGT